MNKLFNLKYIKENFSSPHLKVTLKESFKGISLYAKKPIRKGNVIAYYKFKVYREPHRSYKKGAYSIAVSTKGGNTSDTLIGDIYPGSLESPKYNIPFWAYFSNEPSMKQDYNSYIDDNLKSNYLHRSRVRSGDTMVYKLIAARDIDPGEEIVWCYGEYYDRDYNTSCE